MENLEQKFNDALATLNIAAEKLREQGFGFGSKDLFDDFFKKSKEANILFNELKESKK